tara:strand:+ start:1068 stop:1763 length:696 start_codon:yes stop_codon:yes gene_type:complete
MPEQLAFDLFSPSSLSEESYYIAPANEVAFTTLSKWPDWPDIRSIYLYGERGSGKSHLSAIWQKKSEACSLSSKDLSLENVLSYLPNLTSFVLEDIEYLKDEESLFHLLNLVKEKQGGLLLTSQLKPSALPFSLPDLMSRLKSLPFLEISRPDEQLLKILFLKRFSDIQLKVSPQVLDYGLKYLRRSYCMLDDLVNLVDKLNWQEQKPLTVPLLKRAFSILQESSLGKTHF